MIIESKYSIGDVVYFATTRSALKVVECPDCKDTRKWEARTPVGEVLTFSCPRCTGWQHASRPVLNVIAPEVTKLTIGSILTNSADSEGISYMCNETGVGSGRVYRESHLFIDEAIALRVATAECSSQMAEPQRASQYNAARLAAECTFTAKSIEDAESRRREFQFKLEDVQRAVFDESISDADLRTQLKRDLETI